MRPKESDGEADDDPQAEPTPAEGDRGAGRRDGQVIGASSSR